MKNDNFEKKTNTNEKKVKEAITFLNFFDKGIRDKLKERESSKPRS